MNLPHENFLRTPLASGVNKRNCSYFFLNQEIALEDVLLHMYKNLGVES